MRLGQFIQGSISSATQVNQTSSKLQLQMQKLSSGLRINSAKDDAAGLQLSNRIDYRVSAFRQANLNVANGVSVAQVAEGALNGTEGVLQRMRELALQAANGVYTDDDRLSLNEEYTLLKSQIDAIALQTTFGDRKLLDGTFGVQQVQAGSDGFEQIPLVIYGAYDQDNIGKTTDELTQYAYNANINMYTELSGTATSPTDGNPLTPLNGMNDLAEWSANTAVDGTEYSPTSYGSARDYADAINQSLLTNNLVAEANTQMGLTVVLENKNINADGDTTSAYTVSFDLYGSSGPANLVVNIPANRNSGEISTALATAINGFQNLTGVTASSSGNEARFSLSTSDLTATGGPDAQGANIRIENFAINPTPTSANGIFKASLQDLTPGANNSEYVTFYQEIAKPGLPSASIRDDVVGSGNITFYDELGNVVPQPITNYTIDVDEHEFTPISDTHLTTAVSSQLAISIIDSAISLVDRQRASLGATMNRFSSAMNVNAITSEKLSRSSSAIKDTDFAKSTAIMTKQKILSDSATALTSQANELARSVLSLLN